MCFSFDVLFRAVSDFSILAHAVTYLFYFCISTVSFEDSQYEFVPLTAEKVLEFIEQAYPNPITPEDLAR